jgi:hypothetical protein
MQQIQQQQPQQGWFGNLGGQYGQPSGADPYSAWLQQALASQYRGMQGAGQPGQQGQFGGQTLH